MKTVSIDKIAVQHFWQHAMRHRRLFALSWLIAISSVGIGVFVPYYIGKILGSLAQPESNVTPLIVGLVVTSILTVIINYIAFKSYFELQPRIMADLDDESLDVLLKRGTRFHNDRVAGKLVSDVNDYSMGFMLLSNAFFVDILPFVSIVVVGITLVAINSLLLGGVLLFMTAIAIITTLRFRIRMKPYRQKRQAVGKAVIAHTADTIVNNQSVKTFANESYEQQQHETLASQLLELRIKDWGLMAADGSKRLIALFLFEIVFVLVVTWEVHQNPAVLATGIFAFSYTVMLSNRLFQIGNMMRQVEESLLQVAPMTEILREDIEVVDASGAPKLKTSKGEITFDQVEFRYEDGASNDAVFDGLSIHIKPGEKVGLVGPSGGGKTTLTKLLLRFEDIDNGHITIDGQDIAHVTQQSLRQNIAYVSQEPILFHRTIRENITYGHINASDDQIRDAARKASADDFIQKLPQAYDTIVGERGVKLSGGQRQRIAIARAVLKKAPILVLDEATSALDSESEKLIQSALAELMTNKTAIVIAHRLSTIQKMDRILVLDNGQIVEQGSHKTLLSQNGLYAKLWAHQSGGFIQD